MTDKLTRKILVYTGIAYAITWIIAFGIYFLFKGGYITGYQLNLYHSFAAIGPSIGAVIASYIFYGREGVGKLLSKIRLPSLPRKEKFFLLSPIIFFLIGLPVHAAITSEWYSFTRFAIVNWASFDSLIVWLLPLLTYAFFEEIGWRGFLLPHLQDKYTAWTSTIILAIIWALWHTPFFFYRFNFSVGISIGFFFGIFVGAIIMTSIYNSSRGFLIPAMLFHFLNNLCSEFDKEIIVAVLSTGFVFMAVYIFKTLGKPDLSTIGRQRNYFAQKEKPDGPGA